MSKITFIAITPMTPNFIKLSVGKSSLPVECVGIEEFTDAQIKEIGANWTEELIKKARKRRKS